MGYVLGLFVSLCGVVWLANSRPDDHSPVSPGHSRLDDKGMAPAALAGAPVHAKIVSR